MSCRWRWCRPSLLLAGVAAVTIVIGVGAAWAVTTFQFPGRDALAWMLVLPLAIPTYIVAYIYVDLLDSYGPVQAMLRAAFGWKSAADYWFPSVRSLGGAILLMGLVLYPYVYLAARAMFQTQAAQFAEAARVLGARPFRLAMQISLPLARPAIAVGVALALLETLNDIGLSEYLGVQTLTLSIFSTWLNRNSLPGAAQIACVMLVFVAALIALERYGRRGRAFTAMTQQGARFSARIVLKGPSRFIATLLCCVPVVLGFLLPTGFLIYEVVLRGLFVGFDPALIRPALTTVALAAVATMIVLAIGFSAIAAARYLRHSFIDACVNVAGIGYAIPGTVLALGLLTPLVLVDESLNTVTRALGGSGVGLYPGRLGGRADHRLYDPLPRHRARFRAGRILAHRARVRRRRAPARRRPGDARAHHPLAAAAPGALGRGAAGVRRLPQGIAGDAAAAPAQCRDAFNLHLSIRDARQLRGRLAGGADHHPGRHSGGDADQPPRGCAVHPAAAVAHGASRFGGTDGARARY